MSVELVERCPAPNGIPLVNSNAVAKKSPDDLVALAQEIQKAESFLYATTCGKLQIIAQQLRFLQQQARTVLMEAKINTDLHNVACNFVKVPGNAYHLYVRPSGQKYFSMLSPKEWDNNPHEYLGSFRLEQDLTYTPLQNIEQRDSEFLLINKILSTNEQMSLCIKDIAVDL